AVKPRTLSFPAIATGPRSSLLSSPDSSGTNSSSPGRKLAGTPLLRILGSSSPEEKVGAVTPSQLVVIWAPVILSLNSPGLGSLTSVCQGVPPLVTCVPFPPRAIQLAETHS